MRKMTETKEKKPGVGDFLRSSYAGKFIRKYKWNYLAGMAILIIIDIAQTRLPLIVGGIIDKVDHRTVTPLDFRTAILTMIFIAVLVLQCFGSKLSLVDQFFALGVRHQPVA